MPTLGDALKIPQFVWDNEILRAVKLSLMKKTASTWSSNLYQTVANR